MDAAHPRSKVTLPTGEAERFERDKQKTDTEMGATLNEAKKARDERGYLINLVKNYVFSRECGKI